MNFNDGEIRNLHYGIIHANSNNIIESNTLPYINFDSIPKKYTLVVNGDLILADTSEDRIDSAKGIEISNDSSEKVISGLHTIHLREKKNHTIIGYKTYFVASKGFRHFARKYCEGIKVFSIKPSLLKYATFSYPNSIDEQQKIVDLFAKINIKINLIESKISTLKKYKIGVMQKSFESDKKVALGNILKEINVKTTQNNQYEILSSTSNGLFSQKEYFNHQVASENNVGYKIIKKGELILSPQNLWLGNINLNISFDIGIVSPSYKIYSIDNKVNKMWLIEELKTPKMLYNYKTVSEQGASVVRRNLDTSQFMDIIINIPSVQNSIGNILNALQNKINALSTSLNDMKKLKMHLLQSMFI